MLIADTINNNKWNQPSPSTSPSPSTQQASFRSTRSQDVLTNSTNKTPLTNTSILQATSLSLKIFLHKDKLNCNLDDNNCFIDSQLSPTTSTSPLIYQHQHFDNTKDNVLNYEPLNTSDIATRVRDLLSLHNIGQRIFAKYILGLSQGTVSELLSKPKHWDKLTEKGRESYRKMHTWSLSDDSINALKAISPRKGNKDTYFYQNGGKEDSATEERIAQILNEAQKQMQKNNGIVNGNSLRFSVSREQLAVSFKKNFLLFKKKVLFFFLFLKGR